METRMMPIEMLRLPGIARGNVPKPRPEIIATARAAGVESLAPVIYRETESGEREILSGVQTWLAAQVVMAPEVPARPGPASQILQDEMLRAEYAEPGRVREIRQAIKDHDSGVPVPEIARGLGVDRTLVWHWVRMRELSEECWEALESGEIREGHARLLSGLPEAEQIRWLQAIRSRKLTVAGLRSGIRDSRFPGKRESGEDGDELSPEIRSAIRRLEERGTEYLGSEMRLVHTPSGSGEIRIRYADLEILQGILERIGVSMED